MLTPTQQRPRCCPPRLSNLAPGSGCPVLEPRHPSLPRAGKVSFAHLVSCGPAFLIFWQMTLAPVTAPECGHGWAMHAGRRSAGDSVGLSLLSDLLESFPTTLALTVPEVTPTLPSTIVGDRIVQSPWEKDWLGLPPPMELVTYQVPTGLLGSTKAPLLTGFPVGPHRARGQE